MFTWPIDISKLFGGILIDDKVLSIYESSTLRTKMITIIHSFNDHMLTCFRLLNTTSSKARCLKYLIIPYNGQSKFISVRIQKTCNCTFNFLRKFFANFFSNIPFFAQKNNDEKFKFFLLNSCFFIKYD